MVLASLRASDPNEGKVGAICLLWRSLRSTYVISAIFYCFHRCPFQHRKHSTRVWIWGGENWWGHLGGPLPQITVLGIGLPFPLAETLSSLHYVGVYRKPIYWHGNLHNFVSDQGNHFTLKEVWEWGHDNGVHFCITCYTIQKQLVPREGGTVFQTCSWCSSSEAIILRGHEVHPSAWSVSVWNRRLLYNAGLPGGKINGSGNQQWKQEWSNW